MSNKEMSITVMDRYIEVTDGVATAYNGADVTDRVDVQFGDVVTLGDDGRIVVHPYLADGVPVVVPGVVVDGVERGPFVLGPCIEATGVVDEVTAECERIEDALRNPDPDSTDVALSALDAIRAVIEALRYPHPGRAGVYIDINAATGQTDE